MSGAEGTAGRFLIPLGAGLPPLTGVMDDELGVSGLGPGAPRGLRMGAVMAAFGYRLMALGRVTQ